MTGYRSLVGGIAAVIMLVLASCGSTSDAAGSSSKPSLEELTQQSLSTLAGVKSVGAHQTAVTRASSDRSDPDSWSLDIDVTMADDATGDQVAAAADATRAITSSFTKPALASKSSDGFVLEFNIRAFDANQTLDTHGTFGEPDDS